MNDAILWNVMIHSHLQKRLTEFISSASKLLIVILGPTASGKTAISIEMAEWLNGEIVNADSRQLYKYLDIGTAKITPEEMRNIPHHLLDVLDPKEEATAAWYQKQATTTIDQIHARKNTPMLVGGSMLYISAVIDGLEFPVAMDPAMRSRLDAEYDRDGGDALYQKLMDIDPDTALAFSKNNKPYVLRAMEIYESTKSKPSEVRRKSSCPYNLFIIGIDRPREELVKRINQRTAQLFEHGWIDEVKGLMRKGYSSDDPGMKSHGYREIMAELKMVNGKWKMNSEKELVEIVSAKTRQYAKRQMTWWKHDKRIVWISQP